MIISYAEFENKVRSELEDPGAGTDNYTTWSRESLMAWTNEAIADIAISFGNTLDQQTTTSIVGQDNYQMPNDTINVICVFYKGKQLQRVLPSQFFSARMSSYIKNLKDPVIYCVTDSTLYLAPTPTHSEPDDIVVIRSHFPDRIESTEDIMPFEGKYNDMIGFYVKARAWEQVGDFDSMSVCDAMYNTIKENRMWQNTYENVTDMHIEPRVVW